MENESRNSIQLSIVIVNWNTRKLLQSCLQSIPLGNPPEPYEVIVVDNGSADGSPSMVRESFPRVRLICNSANEGFARAVNQGVRASRGKAVLLLNSDIVVLPESIRLLHDFLEGRPQVGAAAPQLRYPDGTIQKTCRSFPRPLPLLFSCLGLDRLFPRHPKLNEWKMGHWDHQDTRRVEQPMMSALMIRKQCWMDVGELDEAFPIFFNDVDWCYRLHTETTWEIFHRGDTAMIHHHGRSTRRLGLSKTTQSNRGLLRFYGKHFMNELGLKTFFVFTTMLGVVAAGRYILRVDAASGGKQKRRPTLWKAGRHTFKST